MHQNKFQCNNIQLRSEYPGRETFRQECKNAKFILLLYIFFKTYLYKYIKFFVCLKLNISKYELSMLMNASTPLKKIEIFLQYNLSCYTLR